METEQNTGQFYVNMQTSVQTIIAVYEFLHKGRICQICTASQVDNCEKQWNTQENMLLQFFGYEQT